jgi:hypothetical protein
LSIDFRIMKTDYVFQNMLRRCCASSPQAT